MWKGLQTAQISQICATTEEKKGLHIILTEPTY